MKLSRRALLLPAIRQDKTNSPAPHPLQCFLGLCKYSFFIFSLERPQTTSSSFLSWSPALRTQHPHALCGG